MSIGSGRLVLTAVLLLGLSSASSAEPKSFRRAGSGPQAKISREITNLDEHRVRAMLENDAAALDRLLADDLAYTHSNGRIETKSEFIGRLKSGEVRYVALTVTERNIRLHGDGAVVTGRADMKVQAGGRELAFSVRFTECWARIRGRFQLVAWQSTTIPEEGPKR